MVRTTNRRAASAVLAAATALATLAPGLAAANDGIGEPADAASAYLVDQLVDDERIETTFGDDTFDDPGLTADVVIALAGAQVAGERIEAATDWLEGQAGSYTGTAFGDVYAGSVAKLLVVAAATDRATTFGDVDLVEVLEGAEDDDGRYRDDSEFGDFSSVISQSLAVIGLTRAADTAPSADAVAFLADQACDTGGFPSDLDAETCTAEVDATGFAVQALLAAGEDETAGDAVAWLLDVQADDGSFGGQEAAANANSTGVAAVALAVAGEDDAAGDAGDFLATLQDDCAGGAPGGIRFADDEPGDVTRATAQALPGLTGVGLLTVTADGAAADAPSLDCPTRFSDVDYAGSVHASAILELTGDGVISGRADGTFRPTSAISRGQFATWLAGVAGIDDGDEHGFTDVDGSVHAGAIAALAEAGVVDGYGDGTFRPGTPVTRAHAAAILARWLGLDPVEDDAFDDIADSTHRTAINAAADAGVVRGRDGAYQPDTSLRRDQAASLLHAAGGLASAS